MEIKRLDHLGIVAGVAEDYGLVRFINEKLGVHSTEEVTEGQCVLGMVINGLGFTDRPLSLIPQFFSQVPTELLLGDGVTADKLNRHKLGRVLESIYEYGTEKFFCEVASHVAIQAHVDQKYLSLDTTTFSVSGEYSQETDTGCIKVLRGFSKDGRSDLKQIVTQLIVSHDGGVPLILSCHDGNSSDAKLFCKRTEELKKILRKGQVLVADSKLYGEENSKHLKEINFITRIPETISLVKEKITLSVEHPEMWKSYEGNIKFQEYIVKHYEMEQKWCVFYSEESINRAQKTMERQREKEFSLIEKDIRKFSKQEFSCKEDGYKQAEILCSKWKFHSLQDIKCTEKRNHKGAGRPKKNSQAQSTFYFTVSFSENDEGFEKQVLQKACFVLGTNDTQYSAEDLLKNYKAQGSVERGFRFLKEPSFFTSSFFLKKPERIEALVCIMSIALMIYSVAQKRIRHALEKTKETVPNQIGKPVRNPTLKWIFQMFVGIHFVSMVQDGVKKTFIQGMEDIHHKTLNMLKGKTISVYYIETS